VLKRITFLFHSDRVQLLPEPDAAALWGTRDEPAVLYGRDMLVDNGGGTTDIVCYQKGEIERCQKHLAVRQSDVAGTSLK
jgi:actin-like ATPase involved in cell morphogenesis